MVTLAELRARVASDLDVLDLPSWPNPHAGMAQPRDDEYSRLTDPGRYRVVHECGRAWARRLQADLGATADDVPPLTVDQGTWSVEFARGVRLTSPRPGTLPLVLLERDVPQPRGEPLAVLGISVARADVMVDMQPDCGCDACDYGSVDLLDAVDATIGHVVGGPFVALRAKSWHAHWCPDGGAMGSDGHGPDYHRVMELCRRLAGGEHVRLPWGVRAFVGRSWLG